MLKRDGRDAEAKETSRTDWPVELQKELKTNEFCGVVGCVLVSETDKVRVWHLRLPIGKRCRFHRHVLDYFWTAHNPGRARGYFDDGRIADVTHYQGETKHFTFGKGEYFVHSVENVSDTDLLFTLSNFSTAPIRRCRFPTRRV